ncbi:MULTISPECIES: CbtB domain-containing protein [unclassified Roseivivax]|uniref:CbtB domain-containing protein n=1 Tax=Roseivivax sp. GX 12232 TaxID=2900547 RepID=UPI001E3FFE2E|nr:CbtB domain-containing protein [Roseivivax sp. GX 12232]MCE0504805.1 CbtB-domain containing protein [Roseivivax sp. GX 12232]
MTTTTLTAGQSGSRSILAALSAAVLGLGILWMAGHAQAGALHDAAHDVRHATGFPCH